MGKKKCSGTAHILVVTGGRSAGCNSSSTCSSSVFLFMSAWKQILNAENITKKKQQQQRSIMTLPLLWYLSGTEGSGLHTNDNCLSSLDAVFILGSQGFFMQTLPGHRRAAEGSCPWLTVRKMKSRRNLSYLVTAWVKRAHRATSSSLKWSSASVNLHPACPCSREKRKCLLCICSQQCNCAWAPKPGSPLAGLCCASCQSGKGSVWLLRCCVLVGKLSCWWHLLLGS